MKNYETFLLEKDTASWQHRTLLDFEEFKPAIEQPREKRVVDVKRKKKKVEKDIAIKV